MALKLSCAFATSAQSHDHARIAEDLGYAHAWFYDSPALYPDVWVQLCRAAERTSRIGLGPGVLVPSLRHPMVNAAAIATLVSIAGADRVAIAIGSGFTGRLTMGQRPLKWSYVTKYVQVLRALLRGEEVEWENRVMRMLHPEGYGAPRPIECSLRHRRGRAQGRRRGARARHRRLCCSDAHFRFQIEHRPDLRHRPRRG